MVGGVVTPIALAVLRLINRKSLVIENKGDNEMYVIAAILLEII